MRRSYDSTAAYVLTTPLRDELELLPDLVRCVEAQTIPPAAWVLVDDGSRDDSRAWLERRLTGHAWAVARSAPRKSTTYLECLGRVLRFGVEQALGLARARGADVSFVATLDADVRPAPRHYEALTRAFADDPRIGVLGSLLRDAAGVPEPWQRLDFPWGSTQAIRLECLDAIGGMPTCAAPDAVTNIKARARGWRCAVLDAKGADDDEARAELVRPMSSRDGIMAGYTRMGHRTWFLGLHPLAMAIRALGYSLDPPRAKGLAFVGGWLEHAIRDMPRCEDGDVRDYYRRERLRELLAIALGRGPRYPTRD